jgi:hypothetical protein
VSIHVLLNSLYILKIEVRQFSDMIDTAKFKRDSVFRPTSSISE